MNEATAGSSSPNFEFEALREARNYRRAIIQEFAPYLRGRVLEVGAGIGQMTAELKSLPAIEYLLAVEPEPAFCAEFRKTLPGQPLLEGTIAALTDPGPWHGIVSLNVLEHVPDDVAELKAFARLLGPGRGQLCLFVPAGPEIYAPIDRDFGHQRRYSRGELKSKLTQAGFEIRQMDYFNFVGYFAWWLNFASLGQRRFNPGAVRLFDQWIFRWAHALEFRWLRPPFGQSLIAVATPRL